MSDLQQAGISKENFFLTEPKPPGKDGWAKLLMSMSFVIALGFASYAFMGWMFGEIESIGNVRSTITTIGAITLALGGELTTPLTIWEVFRKVRAGTVSKWDWSALMASIIATLTGLILGAAGLIRVSEATVLAAQEANLVFLSNVLSLLNLWPDLVKGYAPIVLVFTASADGYAHFIETGLYLGSYDVRHRRWEERFEKWSEWGAGSVGWAETMDTQSQPEYNDVGLMEQAWPDEPPVRLDDTPVKGTPVADLGNNGNNPQTHRLDSGEVAIEDIEYLHPAVARSILNE